MFLSEQLYSLTINLPLLPPVSSKFCPPKYTSNTFNTLTQCLILPCIKLGFSLHGEGGVGLTEFWREVVQNMHSLGTMLDVSHSSE